MRVLERSDVDFTRGCVLVPTMGALHDGHGALMTQARALADARGTRAVVTVFVNPTQFNESTDFERYPRTLEADLAICRARGMDAVFAPVPAVVYPPGAVVEVPPLPEVATRPGLEDAHRPGHFAGVCQVVSRLFDLTEPGAGVFGEKDWQQLQVIRAMARAQGGRVEIVAGKTVREADGLAMSSRNRLLDPGARRAAVGISRALDAAGGAGTPTGAEVLLRAALAADGIEPEYAVVRDAASLLSPCGGPCRMLVAARVGGVRLIDNAPWPGGVAGGAEGDGGGRVGT